ncbi:MAG: hypothetical protein R3C30_15040 [Hyphomonadaceae bacterium]
MAQGPRQLYRHCEPATLQALFDDADAADVHFASDTAPKAKANLAQAAFERQAPHVRSRLQAAFFDIGALANDLGEACLREAAGPRRAEVTAHFASLRSSHDRAAWVWLEHPDIFEHARAMMFFQRHSTSTRLADAFEAPATFALTSDIEPLEQRIGEIIALSLGERPRVKIERHDMDDGTVLLPITHEELWTTASEFTEEGDLDARAWRIVHHAAIKIESGVLTVAAERGGAARRAELCKAVAELGLGLSGDLARLPPLTYNLQRFLDLAPFSTDPAHSIGAVTVTSLKVSAPGLADKLIEVSTSGANPSDVRQLMLEKLGPTDRALATVKAAELRVVFSPGSGRARSRAVRLLFSGPSSCRVQLDCAEEALVRSHYLKRWGLLVPQLAPAR